MTLILNGTDNSATTPAVTGTDTDTGVYYPAANQVALATNGTLALLVNATQNTEITASGAAGIVMKPDPSSSGNSARLFFTTGTDGVSFRGSNSTAGGQLTFSTTAIPDNTSGNAKIIFNQYGVGVGAASPSSGAGISFPATQSASSDANTLDDYEEGTWTITVTPGTSGSVTTDQKTGSYTKIGRVVTITGFVNLSAISSPVGSLVYLGGLPFPIAALASQAARLGGTVTNYQGGPQFAVPFYMLQGESRITCNQTAASIAATWDWSIGLSYITTN